MARTVTMAAGLALGEVQQGHSDRRCQDPGLKLEYDLPRGRKWPLGSEVIVSARRRGPKPAFWSEESVLILSSVSNFETYSCHTSGTLSY